MLITKITEVLDELGSTPKAATLEAAWSRLFSILRVAATEENHQRAAGRTDGATDRGISAANARALVADWRQSPDQTVSECIENVEDLLTGAFSYAPPRADARDRKD